MTIGGRAGVRYTCEGGYGEYVIADARYCFPIPDAYATHTPRRCYALVLSAIARCA